MQEERRSFLKTTLGVGAVGVTTLIAAKTGIAGSSSGNAVGSNGVVSGSSPKKEILYKKTQNWDIYYKSAY
ncbi:MAG: hypothetical protein ACI8ZB_002941 [Desulforhopalus sp.]|jgi:hypothetical protein